MYFCLQRFESVMLSNNIATCSFEQLGLDLRVVGVCTSDHYFRGMACD